MTPPLKKKKKEQTSRFPAKQKLLVNESIHRIDYHLVFTSYPRLSTAAAGRIDQAGGSEEATEDEL